MRKFGLMLLTVGALGLSAALPAGDLGTNASDRSGISSQSSDGVLLARRGRRKCRGGSCSSCSTCQATPVQTAAVA